MIEIEGELETLEFEKHRHAAMHELADDLELPGFRKGHVPHEIIEKNIPEIKILERMAILALSELYPKLLQEHKIDAIGKPELMITKLAAGNPLGYKIQTAVLPVWELPDYRNIAKKEPPIKETVVTQEEVQQTIETIRKMRAEKEGELPAYDDNFVKSVGKFENVADFEKRLRESIKLEKETKEKDKRRLKIIKDLLTATPLELPQIVVDYELDLLISQFKHDIERTGMKLEEYLKNSKTTLEDLRKNWEQNATERGKAELLLSRIAGEENLRPTEEEVEENLSFHLGGAKDKKGADSLRAFILNSLTREKVLNFLENLAN